MKVLPLYIFVLINMRVFAQQVPDWTQVTSKIFNELTQECNDSISQYRTRSEEIRSKMEQELSHMGATNDRVLIFGPDDCYFKEGMHKQFRDAPIPLQVHTTRNPQVGSMENLHIDLYQSDKSLFRWLNMLEQLKTLGLSDKPTIWAEHFNNLTPELRETINSHASWEDWCIQEAVCRIVEEIPIIRGGNTRKKLEPIKLKKYLTEEYVKTDTNTLTFPISAEKILASFPMNGQYAFCREESIPGKGYIFFSSGVSKAIATSMGDYSAMKACWTSTNGKVTYTDAIFVPYQEEVWFQLPDNYFEPATLYRMELIAVKESPSSTRNCWAKFRQKTPSKTLQIDKNDIGFVITSLFFRTSRYAHVQDRLNNLQGTIDWETGAITFETDEPLDPLEMNGSKHFSAPVSFVHASLSQYINNNQLLDKMLIYFLAVPQTEHLKDSSVFVVAELDHTSDAPFLRKSLSYPHEESYGSPESKRINILLKKNGYIIPELPQKPQKDTLITNKKVPLITQKDFEKGKIKELSRVKCVLIVKEMALEIEAVHIYQKQILQRIEERATFFRQLDARKAVRNGYNFSKTLAEYKQEELNNLPESAKNILKFNELKKREQTCTLYYSRLWPGTQQYTLSMEIKIGKL